MTSAQALTRGFTGGLAASFATVHKDTTTPRTKDNDKCNETAYLFPIQATCSTKVQGFG